MQEKIWEPPIPQPEGKDAVQVVRRMFLFLFYKQTSYNF